MSDKIKKLIDTLVTFNTSSDVMMASFMVKEGSGNGGNHGRKTDLCIKGCLRNKQRKKSATCEIPREIKTVRN